MDGADAAGPTLRVTDRLCELGIALVWLETGEEGETVLEIMLVWIDTSGEDETVLDVVAEADEAGAATTTVSGEPSDPAIVIVYGVAPGGNVDDLVAKRCN